MLLCLLLFGHFGFSHTMQTGHYQLVSGIMSVQSIITELNLKSTFHCLCSCLSTASCKTAGTNIHIGICRLYNSSPLAHPSAGAPSGWKLYSYNGIKDELVWKDGWVLAFRGVPHINVSMYDVFTIACHNCEDIPVDCFDMTSLPGSCDRHIRSKILDMWDQFTITEVRILLHKDGGVVGNVTFDAIGSNQTTWMKKSRIIDSSWPDLEINSINYCELEGHPMTSRRFYLNNLFRTCRGDRGWIMVIDNLDKPICAYESVTSYPVIFYGVYQCTVWSDTATRDEADSLSILVKMTP